MPAIVRVKRRIDEEPHSAFILNGKKRRLEDEVLSTAASSSSKDKDELSTVLKFAGTLTEQDDTATTQFAARLTKTEAKNLVQQKTSARRSQLNHTERARQEMRQALHEQRFRVVNCLRTASATTESGDTEASSDALDNVASTSKAAAITIVDIEPTNSASTDQPAMPANTNQAPADSDTGYVYDLYLPENDQQDAYVDMMDDNYLSVRIFDDLFYEDCYGDNDDEYDSEDSNQENYFTNEYPDEEDDLEIYGDPATGDNSDEELNQAVRRFFFDEDDEEANVNAHSSDDDNDDHYLDPYVHSVNIDDENFVDDIDYTDVEKYGIAYARYKARILRTLNAPGADSCGEPSCCYHDSSDECFDSANENENENNDNDNDTNL